MEQSPGEPSKEPTWVLGEGTLNRRGPQLPGMMALWQTISVALLHGAAPITRAVTAGRARVLPRMSSDFDTLFEAGSACIKAGDFSQARSYFDEAAMIDPDHEPTKAILKKLGQVAPAEEIREDDDGNQALRYQNLNGTGKFI